MNHKTILNAFLYRTCSSAVFAQNSLDSLQEKYLILNNAERAGLKFNAQATAAAWQNEMDCSPRLL